MKQAEEEFDSDDILSDEWLKKNVEMEDAETDQRNERKWKKEEFHNDTLQ